MYAVIEIAQCAKLSLKEYLLAGSISLLKDLAGITDVRLELISVRLKPVHYLVERIRLGSVYASKGEVLPLKEILCVLP